MSKWIDHDGKGMPGIDADASVDVRFRDGFKASRETAAYWRDPEEGGDPRDYWTWSADKPGDDIVSYRVVQP